MTKKIYDFESDATKQVDIGVFDTQNISPELQLRRDVHERERLERLNRLRGSEGMENQINRTQEVIEIEDHFDDGFSSQPQQERAIEKSLTAEMKLEKKKINWFGILFFVTTLLLAGSLVFVSFKYFAQVSENAKMKQVVQEADEIKKTSNSKIETLTKQKEEVQTKLNESVKEKEDLQKKIDESAALVNTKQGQIDEANKAKADIQAKYDLLEKQLKELQAQLDAIKKAAGA